MITTYLHLYVNEYIYISSPNGWAVCYGSNINLGGFRSQLEESNISSLTEDLWYNDNIYIYIYKYIYIYIYIYYMVMSVTLGFIIFTNPSARAGYDTRSIFKRSLTGLNLAFSFSLTSCLIKAEEHSLPYYLPIAGGRIIGFIPFPRVLVLCEMQSVSSRIWTRVTVFISCGDNHYTTRTSMLSLLWIRDAWNPRS